MEATMEHYRQNPEAFRTILNAAMTGDKAVMPEVRALLDDLPEWATAIGDLMQQTENAVLDAAIGANLLKREATQRALDRHEQRLAEEPGYLEELLIKQIRLDLFMLSAAQQRALERRDLHSDKLLNSAHRRFLASLKSLEQVRKLAPIRIQIAHNQLNVS